MIKTRLYRLFNSFYKTLTKSSKTTITLSILLLFSFVEIFTSGYRLNDSINSENIKLEKIQGIGSQRNKDTLGVKTEVPTPAPATKRRFIYGEVLVKKAAPSPTPTPFQANAEVPSVYAMAKTASINISESSNLLTSVNNFRASNGLPALSSSPSLCSVSEKRLSELIVAGILDNHAGFGKYFKGQSEFKGMGEVLFQSSNKTSPDYAVNEGWAKSTSGHRENMLNSSWSFGCGATNGYISVFIFGKK